MARVRKTVAFTCARLLEFADFLLTIKEEKFNHKKWCEPDHTCKTAACIGGWATLNYTDAAKEYMRLGYMLSEIRYKIEDLHKKQSKCQRFSRAYNAYSTQICNMDTEISILQDKMAEAVPNWMRTGARALGITAKVAGVIFDPTNSFWNNAKLETRNKNNLDIFYTYIGVTAEQAALTLKYLAYTPGNKLPEDSVFNRETMEFHITSMEAKLSKSLPLTKG